MKVRLTRKFSNKLNGIDLTEAQKGDTLDLSPRDAEILLAEGWAEAANPERDKATDRPRRARKGAKSSKKR